ncbi:hypothetical protein B0H19DRAFT_1295244 [Mycena capillaripes]|nr:hypothetical protein B0H19DRAFT_1295244 [Mycena capillaripes]
MDAHTFPAETRVENPSCPMHLKDAEDGVGCQTKEVSRPPKHSACPDQRGAVNCFALPLPPMSGLILNAVLPYFFSWFLLVTRLATAAIHKYRIANRADIGNPRLPPELVDLVLKNDPDARSLYNCALVSHTWLALSRAIHFSAVWIEAPYDDTLLRRFSGATIRPYVREIHVSVDPDSEWVRTHVPRLIAQFPNLTTLCMLHNWKADLASRPVKIFFDSTRPGSGIAVIRDSVIAFALQQIAMAEELQIPPFVVPKFSPLAQLRSIRLDHPEINLRVLSLLSPPAVEELQLHVRRQTPLYASMHAAGPGIRDLRLYFLEKFKGFPSEMPLRAPQPTKLRTLRLYSLGPTSAVIAIATHLLKSVLATPDLEELVIEVAASESDGKITEKCEKDDVDDELEAKQRKAAQAELDRVLQPLSAFKTLRLERFMITSD